MTNPFSGRLPPLRANPLTRARLESGPPRFDLTVSNPTRCGIGYPAEIYEVLAGVDVADYRPDPCGERAAREAIATIHGVDPEAIVLTSSTSEAYAWLFKLLADAGQRILFPAPSYPLFEHLAGLEGLASERYPLDPAGAWQPDLASDASAGARAVLAVHPNNPTGSWIEAAARRDLLERGVPLIVDEVFRDFPLVGEPQPSFAGEAPGLTFVLGGLSKSVGLPQVKLSWIIVGGPQAERRAALERLSFIADTYLSVSTAAQRALPRLLELAPRVQAELLDRCRNNLARLRELLADEPQLVVTGGDAGWSAVLRFPAFVDEQQLALDLLEHDGVAVYPGFLFDFPGPGYLVLSLLPEPRAFDEGVARLVARLAGRPAQP